MNTRPCVSLFLLLVSMSLTQAQGSRLWIRRYDSSADGTDSARAMVLDSHQNVIVTGYTQTDTGDAIQTIKYDSTGRQIWAKRYGSASNDSEVGVAVAVDANDNVYVAGDASNADGLGDYLTVKYDPAGRRLWTRRFDGAAHGNDLARGLAVDKAGNVYVTGSGVMDPAKSDDAITIAYDTNGHKRWTKVVTTPSDDREIAADIAIDPAGNVVIACSSYNNANNDGYDIGVVKYSPAGSRQWAKVFSGPGGRRGGCDALAIDGNGGIYAAGWGDFGSGRDFDYLIVKYGKDGQRQWSTNLGGILYDEPMSIAIGPSQSVYVTGVSTGSTTGFDVLTAKLNSSGTKLWSRRLGGSLDQYDWARKIAVDGAGNAIVAAELVDKVAYQVFATAKYDPNGNPLWLRTYSKSDGDMIESPYDLVIDGTGAIYTCGTTYGTASEVLTTMKYSP